MRRRRSGLLQNASAAIMLGEKAQPTGKASPLTLHWGSDPKLQYTMAHNVGTYYYVSQRHQ